MDIDKQSWTNFEKFHLLKANNSRYRQEQENPGKLEVESCCWPVDQAQKRFHYWLRFSALNPNTTYGTHK